MEPSLVILAAGIGNRYGGLKQIDPIGPNGETIIDYSVFDAIRTGFKKVVFVIRRDIEEAFRQTVSKKFENKIEIGYVFQEMTSGLGDFRLPSSRKKPWGTGHAILTAESQIATPFAVINADDFYGRSGFSMLSTFLKQIDIVSTEYCMVGFVLRNTLSEFGTVARGVCQSDSQDFLKSIIEIIKITKSGNGAEYTDEKGGTQKLSGDEIVSMNMWGFAPTVFPLLRSQFKTFLAESGNNEKAEFYISTELDKLMNKKSVRIRVLHSKSKWFAVKAKENEPAKPEQWFGLTYQDDKKFASQTMDLMIERGEYPKKLWD
jgi:UTP-glucose-1-phosphate uridylyltransferase